jgi:hypothetical protein
MIEIATPSLREWLAMTMVVKPPVIPAQAGIHNTFTLSCHLGRPHALLRVNSAKHLRVERGPVPWFGAPGQALPVKFSLLSLLFKEGRPRKILFCFPFDKGNEVFRDIGG